MQVYRTMHLWHWISAAVCFAALILFTVTGITLNHAASIGSTPEVRAGDKSAPLAVRGAVAAGVPEQGIPQPVSDWVERDLDISLRNATAEWSDEELYVSAPGPGSDAWVSLDRTSGAVRFETTDRGWLAYFNDLHKGRHTGLVWRVFIDVVAAACLFFAITGLVLLWIQARQRRSTWPLVTGGVGLLVVLMIFFAH
jgi:uncharacterized protein